jgi:hypothetical protein
LSGVPPFISNPAELANTSFTKEEVSKMVEGFEGDFKGFQKYFEALGVRSNYRSMN